MYGAAPTGEMSPARAEPQTVSTASDTLANKAVFMKAPHPTRCPTQKQLSAAGEKGQIGENSKKISIRFWSHTI
jgi:hypothetical protein